jgi:hypothetical protein
MGAVKEAYLTRLDNMQTLRRLSDLKAKLTAADTLADSIRVNALRDYSSDEPYDNALSLCLRIASALAIVEIMIEDIEPRP